MPIFTDLLQRGAGHAWLFIPSAILLGALHGLEPGHSKTMMAAFIIAVRGTIRQAVLLGLAATLSHTLIVWVIALGGLYLWRDLAPETIEPYLQLASGVIVIAMGSWMVWRTRRDQKLAASGPHDHHHDHHEHDHRDGGDDRHAGHLHHGHNDVRRIDIGHGIARLQIFEEGAPPRFRLAAESGAGWAAEAVMVETERPDGTRQVFRFATSGAELESVDTIPEPHDFTARLSLGHGDHVHSYDVAFFEVGHERRLWRGWRSAAAIRTPTNSRTPMTSAAASPAATSRPRKSSCSASPAVWSRARARSRCCFCACS